MKITLDLPVHLITEVKIRAAKERRKIKDVIIEALEKGLRRESSEAGRETHSQLTSYLANGGLNAEKAEKWVAEIAQDRESWRG